MVAVDQTIVATALLSIQADLHTRINWAGWTITTYSLAQVLAMPVAGKLSDQFGRKTIFMCAVGFSLIALGLVLLWLPPHLAGPYGWLAVAAGLTGLGMGLAVPATNNATLQLAPDQVAAIAGLRGMFRQSGSILTISATTCSPRPTIRRSRRAASSWSSRC